MYLRVINLIKKPVENRKTIQILCVCVWGGEGLAVPTHLLWMVDW